MDVQYNPIPLNLTGHTSVNLRFQKPDGTRVFCGAAPSDPDDLTNGTVTCTLPSNADPEPKLTLDQTGIWNYIAKVNFPAGRQVISAEPQIFYVV